MQSNARPQPPLDVRPVRTGELCPLQRGGNGGFFLTRRRGEAGEILCTLGGIRLGEVHHINRPFALADECFNGLSQRSLGIAELQGHRPNHRLDGDAGKSIEASHLGLKELGLAEGRRHQQKTTLRKRQQRYLPSHTSITVGVIVKLIHHDLADAGIGSVPQGDVGQDLRRAAQDRRIVIDRGVPSAQADIVGAEFPAERKPLLVDQSLDGARVNRFVALCQRLEMQRRGHQRFARSRRCIKDDVLARVEFENGLLLRRVEFDAARASKVQEPIQQVISRWRLQAG